MKLATTLCLTGVLLMAAKAEAYPILQLDIIGGHYDAATQTIVSSGPDFTLVAVLTPKNNQSVSPYLSDTYYISAAVSPNPGPAAADLGSYTWNGTNYDVTEDMTYGTPPLELGEADRDPGDLSYHSVFPTFFNEFAFQFSPANRTVSYDTADNPGGLTPTSATTNVSYFATFNITTSLVGTNVLHFDLYNSYMLACKKGQVCSPDEDVDLFAPYSHDAQSNVAQVPEPQSLLVMSMGLLFAGRMLLRQKRA